VNNYDINFKENNGLKSSQLDISWNIFNLDQIFFLFNSISFPFHYIFFLFKQAKVINKLDPAQEFYLIFI